MATKKRKTTNRKKQEAKPASCLPFLIILILLVIIIGLLVYIFFPKLTEKAPATSDPTTEKIEQYKPEEHPDVATGYVTECLPVYYYDATSQHFVPIHYPLDRKDMPIENRVQRIMERILAGPPFDGFIPVVPSGTNLHSVRVEGDLATVDISSEVMEYGGGSTTEILVVQSILLSLTDLREIRQVQLLIDGKTESYLPQGTSIDKPLIREGGPNANEYVSPEKAAGYFYLIQKDGKFLTPVHLTWEGESSDMKSKLLTLYSDPPPQLQYGLASPAPSGIRIEKCEVVGDVLSLIIDRPNFAEAFRKHSPEEFLQATILTLYNIKPFTSLDIRVGDEQESLPIWTYSAFDRFRDMPIPPSCYNTFRGEVEPRI